MKNEIKEKNSKIKIKISESTKEKCVCKCKRIITIALLCFGICMLIAFAVSVYRDSNNDIQNISNENNNVIDKSKNNKYIDMYMEIIDNIYNEDEALNDSIEIMSLVIKDDKITKNEKETIMKNAKEKYKLEIMDKDYETLSKEGLIDEELIYFEKGIIITISNVVREDDGMKYSINKYRGGLAAVGSDATIKDVNGKYEIDKKVMWIA